ncbi:MAG: hypothetical protein ACFB51_18370 [Anaerolineae bacterium]
MEDPDRGQLVLADKAGTAQSSAAWLIDYGIVATVALHQHATQSRDDGRWLCRERAVVDQSTNKIKQVYRVFSGLGGVPACVSGCLRISWLY